MPIITNDVVAGTATIQLEACGKVTEPTYFSIDEPIQTEVEFLATQGSLNTILDGMEIPGLTRTYEEYLSNFTQNEFSNVPSGNYTIYLLDGDQNKAETTVSVGTVYEEGFVAGVDVSENLWEMTDAATGFGDAELITNNYIEPGETGAFEFDFRRDDEVVIGFKEIDNEEIGAGLADLKYGYLLTDVGVSTIVDGVIETPAFEEVFVLPETNVRIIKLNEVIELYINNELRSEFTINISVSRSGSTRNIGERGRNNRLSRSNYFNSARSQIDRNFFRYDSRLCHR